MGREKYAQVAITFSSRVDPHDSITIGFVDTEGLHADDRSQKYHDVLFSLVFSLTNVMIFHERGILHDTTTARYRVRERS